MVKKFNYRPAWIFILLIIGSGIIFSIGFSANSKPGNADTIKPAVKDTTPAKTDFSSHKNAAENEKCLKCHGQSKYTYENSESKKIATKKMYAELIIDRTIFYISNHREFKCTDCHSEDYVTFPHVGNLRMEAKPNCLDCHGGDEKYAKFHFENIEKEFMESIHSEKHSEDFTCWMCHNPHTYKINARSNENIKQTIVYDNAICLGCHGNLSNYQLLTDKTNPNLLKKHEWLPNQALHFKSVRCIECHTKKINDSTLVAHKILPKSKAVKNCTECHSSNSVLMAALYKYQLKEVRSAQGFFTSIFASDSYAIGANRNFYLNMLSLVIVGCVIIGIVFHTILRVIK
ncbi:MAG: cytochrome c3 family protein [Bacteroidetes bacterium]|nr:cytochrome c3 family protein [Bacteroidota bacterium]